MTALEIRKSYGARGLLWPKPFENLPRTRTSEYSVLAYPRNLAASAGCLSKLPRGLACWAASLGCPGSLSRLPRRTASLGCIAGLPRWAASVGCPGGLPRWAALLACLVGLPRFCCPGRLLAGLPRWAASLGCIAGLPGRAALVACLAELPEEHRRKNPQTVEETRDCRKRLGFEELR